MKKLFVSTGLAAIGLAGIQATQGEGLDIVSPKAWSISGTLRGFYDDNYNISSTRKGSWGTEVSPTISLNVPLRQTDMGIRYTYGLYYYNDRDSLGLNPFDQSHQVDVWLDHAINERWKINFTDTFTASDQPDLTLTQLGSQVTNYRANQNSIANHANVSLDTQWTSLFGTSIHYGNDFYSYKDNGSYVKQDDTSGTSAGGFLIPGNGKFPNQFGHFTDAGGASLAGLLDRIEQNIGLDFSWTLSPETVLSVGYAYNWANYTGDRDIAVFNYQNPVANNTPPNHQSYIYNSSARDGSSHNAHIGLTHQLTANLTLNAIVGASYSDNSNDPFSQSQTVSPTATVSVNYTYLPGSYVQFGVNQGHNATDVVDPGVNGSITQYQDTTTVYADINHKITEKLTGSLLGQYSYSSYEGGANNSNADSAINLGLNFTYQITRHFSADAGYNFDKLFSSLAQRGFVRNRVYMGLSANY
ncbi:MAG: outer membrane beta-barrel protein [Verrucomicrobiae bacterium]|nr:outer membrane beta-barrel protein [Verrucomicrobiae bacterium]